MDPADAEKKIKGSVDSRQKKIWSSLEVRARTHNTTNIECV